MVSRVVSMYIELWRPLDLQGLQLRYVSFTCPLYRMGTHVLSANPSPTMLRKQREVLLHITFYALFACIILVVVRETLVESRSRTSSECNSTLRTPRTGKARFRAAGYCSVERQCSSSGKVASHWCGCQQSGSLRMDAAGPRQAPAVFGCRAVFETPNCMGRYTAFGLGAAHRHRGSCQS